MMNNVYFIGMMGAGKTVFASTVAKKLKRPFVDVDAYIEQTQGVSIPQIFAQEGQEAFREIEHQAIASLAQENGWVISLGGGAVLRQDNVEIIRSTGVVLYLERPVDHIMGDVDIAHRPNLRSKEDVERVYESRRGIYEQACHIKIVNDGSFAQTRHQILKALEEWGSQKGRP